MKNGVMLQGFEWELPADGKHWRRLEERAFALQRQGFTALWMPPVYKGAGGVHDVGYGVYDLYDLGEFDQKGTVGTKYGTRTEFLGAVQALKAARVQPLADLVLNHRMSADECEDVTASRVDWADHRKVLEEGVPVRLYTRFTFPGRKGKYSDFIWDAQCFTGSNWDERRCKENLYLISGKHWAEDVDEEHGNYDYLMGADVDFRSPRVLEEMRAWGHWFVDTTGVEGFRVDAVKHIAASFYREWLPEMRRHAGKEMFAVGEYWQYDVSRLHRYLDQVDGAMSLFDAPLHERFHRISCSGGNYDMTRLFDQTLVGTRPHQAVTFVDNHDTQPGQSLESWVGGWFKAAAYGLILLRSFGYPCVFWGDLYGIPKWNIGPVTELPLLMRLRRLCAYGAEHDYFDHEHVIGFTREGDDDCPGSGLAFLCTNREGGAKRMYVGKRHAGRWFRCALGDEDDVRIDAEGSGLFRVKDGRCSVYVLRLTAQEAVQRIKAETLRFVDSRMREMAWRAKRKMKRKQ